MSIKTCFNCFFSHYTTRQNKESVGIFQESWQLEWPFWFSQCPVNSGGQNMMGKVPSNYVLKEFEQIFRSTLELSEENSQILHAISSCGWQGCGNKYSPRASSTQFVGESKIIYYLHHSCRVIEDPTTITRNICFFEYRHPKVIDHRKHSFEERTQPFRNISQRTRAGCTNKSSFNWIFMKLPNCTKKRPEWIILLTWEARTDLFTTPHSTFSSAIHCILILG